MDEIKAEVEHIAPVVAMLEEYLLRKEQGLLKEAAVLYWRTTRMDYLRVADPQSARDFDTAWYFFAFILSLPYSREDIPNAGERP